MKITKKGRKQKVRAFKERIHPFCSVPSAFLDNITDPKDYAHYLVARDRIINYSILSINEVDT
jgi:hypothetical protein